MNKFDLEFILNTYNATEKSIRDSLVEFTETLEIVKQEDPSGNLPFDFKINLRCDDPTIIFDICGQFGRIKSVKIDEQ